MIIIINNNNNLITKDLSEVVRLWKLEKVQIIPIVLSTTGVILKTSHEGLKNLRYEKKTLYILLQKAVILNTTRIFEKFLSQE